MKNKINIWTLLLASITVSFSSYGMKTVGSESQQATNNSFQLKSAGCAPAQAAKLLAYNNVSALIRTGGSMWMDRANGIAAYEVPKNSGQFMIFSGSLWMGGEDVNGQLKLAAIKFGSDGNDFWTGPLSVTPNTGNPAIGRRDYGAATVDAATCNEFDKFFITEREQIAEFDAWWNCQHDPNCDVATEFPGYTIPASILTWPAHGDLGKFQDFYLAPFYDRDGDGVYNPTGAGDYPWYDLKQEIDCRNDRQITLFGDYNMWWVFNDKGDIHTESGGEQIGMEIRAQAFAFATNDEVNNMTFYNYELINRSTQTLTNTYFAAYTDVDLGCAGNDYAGCDVQRGLGYVYNAVDDDFASQGLVSCSRPINGIPPAIGIDFFEGPYQDNDGIDNPLTTDVAQALAQGGIPYRGLGIGYGDGIVDNERFGMRKFVFYNNTNDQQMGDPSSGSPTQFYNYMKGFWKNGDPFLLGGDAANIGVDINTPVDYVYFGDTDPYLWASRGLSQSFITAAGGWTEATENNSLEDKRIVQSAGPFTLEPGAVNNITLGVIYSKAQNGGAWQSVLDMRTADDKAQALFDNCFRILSGPDAPDVAVQELDKEVILYLSGTDENFTEKDPIIEALGNPNYDIYYRFQGYKIYQVLNNEVGPSDLDNTDLARLVAQVDKKDGVGQIVNHIVDPVIGMAVPTLMVEGADQGIKHSFRITEDLFAQGSSNLVNHKKYYYMVIAYGYNNYAPYDPTTGFGQAKPYFPSRKSTKGAIKSVVAIPHITTPENGGSVIHANYGDGPKITRVEGRGNGERIIELTAESETDIVFNYTPKEVTYDYKKGPIGVKVVDPLNVKGGTYELKFIKDAQNKLDSATWVIVRNGAETIYSDQTIAVQNEQIIPEWGIAIEIEQYVHPFALTKAKSKLLNSFTIYEKGENQWLSGVSDVDGNIAQNWIRSGSVDVSSDGSNSCTDPVKFNDIFIGTSPNNVALDPDQDFEKVLNGTWAPYRLAAKGRCNHEPLTDEAFSYRNFSDLSDISSVDIVITKDRSKWTRVVVLETQDNTSLSWDGNTKKQDVKLKPSVDKYGVPTTDPSGSSTNPDDANYISGVGMSWFPGYAIDVQTGERLNMAFGEDSWLANDNGNDMIFNPTSKLYNDFGGQNDPASVVFGGKHYVYVFRNADKDNKVQGLISAYDNGAFLKDKLISNNSTSSKGKVWKGCMYVGIPMLSETAKGLSDPNDPYSYIEEDVKLKIRVPNEYRQHADNGQYVSDGPGNSVNGWYNYYRFSMDDIATETNTAINVDSIKDSIMNAINVVPNPYYAYSNYETSRLDNRIKIVNLPDACTIKIYNVSGTLIKTFTKDNNRITSIDWDLTNSAGIPIAGGLYLIHVDVPSIGRERILKWFGVVRPPDLKNF